MEILVLVILWIMVIGIGIGVLALVGMLFFAIVNIITEIIQIIDIKK